MLPEGARFCPVCGTPVKAQGVFCPQCGFKNAEGARFCMSCGTRLPDISAVSAHRQKAAEQEPPPSEQTRSESKGSSTQMTFLGYPIQLPPRVNLAGDLFTVFRDMGVSAADSFAESLKSYTLDTFLLRAEGEVQALFDHADQKALDFITRNGLYSYDLFRVRRFTGAYRRRWAKLFHELKKSYHQIEAAADAEIEYRAERKANRGRVIGGGFGLSGAIDGMLTAGAINAATGLLHSAVNGVGNAVTNIDRGVQKRQLFGTDEMREEIRGALMLDITNTYYGLLDIFNTEWPDAPLPVFDENDYISAHNICEKLLSRSIPPEKARAAVCQMIQACPIADHMFITAAQFLPHDLPEIRRLAEYCGILLKTPDMSRQRNFSLAAGTLLDNEFYVKNERSVNASGVYGLLRRLLQETPKLAGSGLCDAAPAAHDSRLDSGEQAFLLLKSENNWSSHVLLTDRRVLFKKGSCPVEQFLPVVVRGTLYPNLQTYLNQGKLVDDTSFPLSGGDGATVEQFLRFAAALLICVKNRPVDCTDLTSEIYREACDRPPEQRGAYRAESAEKRRQLLLVNKIKAAAFDRLRQRAPQQAMVVFFAGTPFCLQREAQAVLKTVQWRAGEIPLFYLTSTIASCLPRYMDLILVTDQALYLYQSKGETTYRMLFDAVTSLSYQHTLFTDRFVVNQELEVNAHADQALAQEFAADMTELVLPMLLYHEAQAYKLRAIQTCLCKLIAARRN